MAKKQFTTVNINDFFAPEPGPPAPMRLTTTSAPPPPPISRVAGNISSSGQREKIPTSRKRFDDDTEYVSKRRGKNRGGRNKGGMRRPTPHLDDITRGRNKPLPIVNIGQIIYNRRVELSILKNLKKKGQPLEFMSEGYSSPSARQIHMKDGTDNLLKDDPSFIQPRINNLTNATDVSTSSTRARNKQYTPSSVSRYLQTASINSSQPAANIASAVGETLPTGTPGRMMSSTAKRLADDTMRAASVIHSSKLGFAAIGMGALGAAFGISSLRSKSSERQMEMGNRI
jgi:hypothetical protein